MKTEPFWADDAALEPPSGAAPPARVDALVVGGGFTGLSAARALAQGGRETLVIDAGALGDGASRRNGGMIGWGHRAKLGALSKRYGEAAAIAILGEARRSYDFTRGLIAEEGVDCALETTGRYLGAASPKHYEALARELAVVAPKLGFEAHILTAADQAREIATDAYCGGALLPSHAGLHPGRFHAGLLAAARRAGATALGGVTATAVAREGSGWRVTTPQGEIRAATLALATNGYTGFRSNAFGCLAKRLLPLPSYMIATEPLGASRVRALMPGGRMYVDTRSVHSYFRADPSGQRILWGGRASLLRLSPERAADRLRRHMASVFPSLRDVAITHSWWGRIAYTRDVIPHVAELTSGPLAGAFYAMGYCGSGVAMAPYLGWRMAQKILGTADAPSALDAAVFEPFIARFARPVGLAATEIWHRQLDRLAGVKPIR